MRCHVAHCSIEEMHSMCQKLWNSSLPVATLTAGLVAHLVKSVLSVLPAALLYDAWYILQDSTQMLHLLPWSLRIPEQRSAARPSWHPTFEQSFGSLGTMQLVAGTSCPRLMQRYHHIGATHCALNMPICCALQPSVLVGMPSHAVCRQ